VVEPVSRRPSSARSRRFWQKLRTGDVDFSITSTANSATLQPRPGCFRSTSCFRSEDHLVKALADPGVAGAFKDMINSKVQGAHTLALATMGFPQTCTANKEIHKVADLDNVKVRVQATATEDTMFPGLWRASRPMPVWRRPYGIADRHSSANGRKRHQRLPVEQAFTRSRPIMSLSAARRPTTT